MIPALRRSQKNFAWETLGRNVGHACRWHRCARSWMGTGPSCWRRMASSATLSSCWSMRRLQRQPHRPVWGRGEGHRPLASTLKAGGTNGRKLAGLRSPLRRSRRVTEQALGATVGRRGAGTADKLLCEPARTRVATVVRHHTEYYVVCGWRTWILPEDLHQLHLV